METLQALLDKDFPARSGERETASCGSSFDRVKARIAAKLHRTAEALSGKAEGHQAPRHPQKIGSQATAWFHHSADCIKQMKLTDETEKSQR